jgi:phosphatidylglycerol---prolipoprotein diacylglyceryl transferase
MLTSQSTAYAWLMVGAIGLSLVYWSRLAKQDARLLLIYVAGIAGAFLGAKIVYLGAEGWLHWHDPNRWLILATGKSILGGLLGGYAGVEIAKRRLSYPSVTGDRFALIVPATLMMGRIGCILNGCCLGRVCTQSWWTVLDGGGVPRWPAAQTEFLFNLLALGFILGLRRRRILPGQHFHLYLIGYGLFRFLHEMLRDTPLIAGPFSGYQLAALGVAGFGFAAFHRRQRSGKGLKLLPL